MNVQDKQCGAPITHYVLEMDQPQGWAEVKQVNAGDRLSHTQTGLDEDTEYRFRVSAHNRKGGSEQSAVCRAKTKPAMPPDSITDLCLQTEGKDCFTIRWQLPAFDGGSPLATVLLKWRLENDVDSGFGDETEIVLLPDQATYTFKSCPPMRSHEIYLVAVNIKGASEPTGVLAVVLPAELAPIMCEPPFCLGATHSSIHVGWGDPKLRGVEVSSIILRRMDKDALPGDTVEETTTLSADARSLNVEDLSTDTKYQFSVEADSRVGASGQTKYVLMSTMLDMAIPYNEIIRILHGMKTLMLDGKSQQRGCTALTEIAMKRKDDALAVAKLGGFSAVLRAMWAYPNSADIQEQGCALMLRLGEFAEELEIVMEPGARHLLTDMQARPWASSMRAQALRFINMIHQKLQSHGAVSMQHNQRQ